MKLALSRRLAAFLIVVWSCRHALFAADIAGPAGLPKQYPWDRRPGMCFVDKSAGTASHPRCTGYSDWPDFWETKYRVDKLFQSQSGDGRLDLELIGRAERELGLSSERFRTGAYYFDAWFESLQENFTPWGPHYDRLEEWKADKNGAGYVALAEAKIRISEAWSARGGGYANTVSPEGWAIFGRKLAEANRILDAAPPAVRKMGPWYAMKLQLAYLRQDDPIGAFESATTAWPDYFRLYSIEMNFATPRWGGSFERMDKVARFAAMKSQSHWGAGFYALLYMGHFLDNGEYTFSRSVGDWALVKQGARDMESRGLGVPNSWYGLARLACQVRDRAEARRMFEASKKIEASLRPPDTPFETSVRYTGRANTNRNGAPGAQPPDACREFAYGST